MIKETLLVILAFSSSVISFAQQYGLIKDARDGKIYKTVKIGDQEWMAENLHSFYFRNGDQIPIIKNDDEWAEACENNQPACAYFNNDSGYGNQFGVIYNIHAVNDKRGIAPVGWHVANDNEWILLFNRLGGISVAGKYLKDTIGWDSYSLIVACDVCANWHPSKKAGQVCINCNDKRTYSRLFNGNGTNSTGFNARPTLIRKGIYFLNEVHSCILWSRDNSYFSITDYPDIKEYKSDEVSDLGLYVRCIKDNTETSIKHTEEDADSEIDLSKGLVAYYPFSGNAGDSSGNNNHGIVKGAILSTDRFGNENKAYSFNGINSSIETLDSESLSLIGDISMSAWVYDNGASNNYHTILNKRLNGNWSYNMAYSFYYGPGGSMTEINKIFSGRRIYNGAKMEYKFSNTKISFKKWQHITVVINNNIIKFYIDGLEAGYNEFGNNFTTPMVNQLIGLRIGTNGEGGEWMSGKLDEIRIYNRALNESEISYLATH